MQLDRLGSKFGGDEGSIVALEKKIDEGKYEIRTSFGGGVYVMWVRFFFLINIAIKKKKKKQKKKKVRV